MPNEVELYADSFDRLRFGNTELIAEIFTLMKRESERNGVYPVIGITDLSFEFTKPRQYDIWPNVSVLITRINERRIPNIWSDFAYLTWRNCPLPVSRAR